MKEKGKAMHVSGSKAIKDKVNKYLDNLPNTLDKGFKPVVAQIKDEYRTFFEQNSSTGTRQTSARRVVSKAKERLANDLISDIDNLVNEWKLHRPAVPEPEVEELEDENLDDDRFFDLTQPEKDDGDYLD
jgi:hypothetical protein